VTESDSLEAHFLQTSQVNDANTKHISLISPPFKTYKQFIRVFG
jgi:hypothetical protein